VKIADHQGSSLSADLCQSATVTLIERHTAPSARFSLLNDMYVERGSIRDWEILSELHYKSEGSVWGAHFWKITLHDETIGCLVTGSPKGLLKERHIAFPKLKPKSGDALLINTQRYSIINHNFRVISRFVFDTPYRGIGCGYRAMNLAARMDGSTFMEIQSSMSKFNHFGQMAGFNFIRPLNSNKYDKGIMFFRQHFEALPQDYEAIMKEIDLKSDLAKEKLFKACRWFYFQNSALERTGSNRHNGSTNVEAMSVPLLIKNLQQLILSSPMYGVIKNPDKGNFVPSRLPLVAFDWQKPHEPLNLPNSLKALSE